MLKLLVLATTLLVVSQAFLIHSQARCGGRTYNPAFHLCCHGHLNSKHGISPHCCGTRAYDFRFKLCCNGHINSKFGISPHCCGSRVYDSKFRSCHNGRIISG